MRSLSLPHRGEKVSQAGGRGGATTALNFADRRKKGDRERRTNELFTNTIGDTARERESGRERGEPPKQKNQHAARGHGSSAPPTDRPAPTSFIDCPSIDRGERNAFTESKLFLPRQIIKSPQEQKEQVESQREREADARSPSNVCIRAAVIKISLPRIVSERGIFACVTTYLCLYFSLFLRISPHLARKRCFLPLSDARIFRAFRGADIRI